MKECKYINFFVFQDAIRAECHRQTNFARLSDIRTLPFNEKYEIMRQYSDPEIRARHTPPLSFKTLLKRIRLFKDSFQKLRFLAGVLATIQDSIIDELPRVKFFAQFEMVNIDSLYVSDVVD